MTTLPRRLTEATEDRASRELGIARYAVPPRAQRAVERGVAIEHGRAIVQAARVRGLGYVSHEALHVTGELACEEMFWSDRAPHASGRYQLIADTAAYVAADMVDELRRP